MKEQRYCYKCNNDSVFRRVLKEDTINVLGTMPITFIAPVSICAMCGEEIFDEEIDSLYQQRAFELCGLVHDRVEHKWVKPKDLTAKG